MGIAKTKGAPVKKCTIVIAALSLLNLVLLSGILYAVASARLIWNDGDVSVADLTATTVRLADHRISSTAGGAGAGQGTLTLYDRATDKQFVEFGFYSHGAGIFTPHRFEFWTGKEVSIAGWDHLPALQVRDQGDTRAAVWLNGAGYVGAQHDHIGFAFGSFNGGWTEVGRFEESGQFIVHDNIIVGGRSVTERLSLLEQKFEALSR